VPITLPRVLGSKREIFGRARVLARFLVVPGGRAEERGGPYAAVTPSHAATLAWHSRRMRLSTVPYVTWWRI
jgi:hypothetical protein